MDDFHARVFLVEGDTFIEVGDGECDVGKPDIRHGDDSFLIVIDIVIVYRVMIVVRGMGGRYALGVWWIFC